MSIASLTFFPETASALGSVAREAAVDYSTFETPIERCDLNRCKATCCHDGVYLSREEAAQLTEIGPKALERTIHPSATSFLIKAARGRVKTQTVPASNSQLADDYPTHFPATRCIFLDPVGRCSLQLLAVEEGRHPWFYKPMTCWLHPLLLDQPGRGARPILKFPRLENDPQSTHDYPGFSSCTHCGRFEPDGQLAYKVLDEELGFLSQLSGRNLRDEISRVCYD